MSGVKNNYGLYILERVSKYPHGTYFGKEVPEGTAVVSLSQALSVISEKCETWESTYGDLHEEYEIIKADNAALIKKNQDLEAAWLKAEALLSEDCK